MIHYLKRNQIDIVKYDACIKKAYNSRMYAYSWYIDIVADNWDALVLNDYEAIMPVPFMRLKKNLFFKKIVQPHFSQQLGIFSELKMNKRNSDNFITQFKNLKPKSYNFNSFNENLSDNKFFKRDNYELSLLNSYQDIYSNYSKNLKRNITKAKKNNLTILTNINADDFILMKKQTKHHTVSKKVFQKMKQLIETLYDKHFGKLYGVYKEDELIATVFFMYEPNRIVHLFSASTSVGKQYGAVSFLFDEIIKENEKTSTIFDFEGSMIPGVANFFKSYGSSLVNYISYED